MKGLKGACASFTMSAACWLVAWFYVLFHVYIYMLEKLQQIVNINMKQICRLVPTNISNFSFAVENLSVLRADKWCYQLFLSFLFYQNSTNALFEFPCLWFIKWICDCIFHHFGWPILVLLYRTKILVVLNWQLTDQNVSSKDSHFRGVVWILVLLFHTLLNFRSMYPQVK